MTANISDRTRVTCTIACSDSSANNAVTSSALRTALGLGSTEPCTIGSVDGLYNQFVVTVTLGSTATSWSLGLDFAGDGSYITVASGLTTGGVCFGMLPGSVIPAGTAIGACRPYAFRVVLNAADATSTINIVAFQVAAKQNITAADVSSVNTAVAAVSTSIGAAADDISATTVFGRLNAIRDDLVGIGGADLTSITSVLGTLGPGGRTVSENIEPHCLAYGLVTTGGGTGTVTVADFIGRYLINELLIIEDVSSSLTPKLRQSRSIASFNNTTGACTVAALDFSPAVGDKVWVVPRAQTGP